MYANIKVNIILGNCQIIASNTEIPYWLEPYKNMSATFGKPWPNNFAIYGRHE
jgi:hypothetical protein